MATIYLLISIEFIVIVSLISLNVITFNIRPLVTYMTNNKCKRACKILTSLALILLIIILALVEKA